jgi:ABC-type uncharacterized transport system ATPase subunit
MQDALMKIKEDTEANLSAFDSILAHASGDDGIDVSIAAAEQEVREALLELERARAALLLIARNDPHKCSAAGRIARAALGEK